MTASPRIAILTPYAFAAFPGGTEVFNEQLAHVLRGARIFHPPRGPTRSGLRWSLDSIGLEHARRAWGVATEFYREHHRRPFQLAICNGLYGWGLSAFPPGIPTIEVYHFTFAGLATRGIKERGVRIHMRYVDASFDRFAATGKHVVAVGPNVLREVQTFYHHEGKVIPNGVDLALFQPRDRDTCRDELHLPREGRIGLYVGRPEYTKGFDILREVARACPETLFLLVGGAPRLGPNTTVLPRVPHSAMPTVYSAANFLILPSRYEGFNLAILEAIACGLPILVSRAAYPLDEEPGDLGAVVDTEDPTAYAEMMRRLPDSSLRSAQRERVLAAHSLTRFAENWQTHVSELIGGDFEDDASKGSWPDAPG